MNWQKIDPDNLPQGKVLVSLGRRHFLVGSLYYDPKEGCIIYSAGGISFSDPDYYLLLSDLASTLPPDNPSGELK